MRVLKISKRDGTYRTVVAPDPAEKSKLRSYIHYLQVIADSVCPPDVVHGFWPGRSPVTNASYHVGFKYTVNFDLRNFFDTVTISMMGNLLPEYVIHDCFVDGIARQGLPTSPVIANIAAAKMDHDFHNFMLGRLIVYTRYADDLTFSMNDPAQIDEVKAFVAVTVVKHGFELNEKKTCVQCAKAGRRMVTGVAVDNEIHATRASKRRLRAARHRKNKMAATGLAEWCKLKFPTTFKHRLADDVNSRQKFANVIDFDERKPT